MISVYVAGAWVEQSERAKPMIAAARSLGVRVTHDWTAAEGAIHGSSDADLTHVQRRQFSEEDLRGIREADYLWLLAPNAKGACGAWVELGYALGLKEMREDIWHGQVFHYPIIVVSGPMNKRSIFTELADRLFDRDAEALEWLSDLAIEDKETGT